jgi:hypothetical protein
MKLMHGRTEEEDDGMNAGWRTIERLVYGH